MKILDGLLSAYWLMRFFQYVGNCAEWGHPIFNYEPAPVTIGAALLITAIYFLRDMME